MEFTYAKFLSIWQVIALGLAAASIIGAIVLFIIHKIRFSAIKDYKQKYDYLAANEAKTGCEAGKDHR